MVWVLDESFDFIKAFKAYSVHCVRLALLIIGILIISATMFHKLGDCRGRTNDRSRTVEGRAGGECGRGPVAYISINRARTVLMN